MQRTVKGTAVVIGKWNAKESRMDTEVITFANRFKDEKSLNKAIFKRCGSVAIVSVQPFENLYILEDEIFFKYAHIATPTEKAEAEAEEQTENG